MSSVRSDDAEVASSAACSPGAINKASAAPMALKLIIEIRMGLHRKKAEDSLAGLRPLRADNGMGSPGGRADRIRLAGVRGRRRKRPRRRAESRLRPAEGRAGMRQRLAPGAPQRVVPRCRLSRCTAGTANEHRYAVRARACESARLARCRRAAPGPP